MFKVVSAHVIDPYLIKDLLPGFGYEAREAVSRYIVRGDLAFSFFMGDEVIAVIGGYKITDYSMNGWSILGEGIKLCPTGFVRKLRQIIETTMKIHGLKRFFVTVNTDNAVAIRHNAWMGLQSEGILRKYGSHGQDQVMMARVVE